MGSYVYVQRVYNANMRLANYQLPTIAKDGTVKFFDDGLIKLTMQIAGGRVTKITIVTTDPRSSVYMQVFEGFEFGFGAVSTWIQNYEETTRTHEPSKGIVKGILADYDTNADNILTVSLTRVAGTAPE
ncbi:hypothetical protein CHT97_06050 [Lacticaseibacillus chiayiensis]|nr:hypothetical protein CHT97_06050 [Lacticaseibacillus chiayiensis]